MLQKATFRRLLIVATMLTVLTAASPAAALAENIGGGPKPVTQTLHGAARGSGREAAPLASVAQRNRAPGFEPGRRGSIPLGGSHNTSERR